jgi:hypothetical protein
LASAEIPVRAVVGQSTFRQMIRQSYNRGWEDRGKAKSNDEQTQERMFHVCFQNVNYPAINAEFVKQADVDVKSDLG